MTIGEIIKQARERKGLSQAEVGRRLGVSKNAVNMWEAGANGPARKRLQDLADLLEIPPDLLLTDDAPPPETAKVVEMNPLRGRPSEVRAADDHKVIAFGALPRDVPVLGVVVGGADDHFDMNGDVVDYLRRPPALDGKKGVFGLYVVGTSMEPRYEEGDPIYLQEGRNPAIGDYVVIEMKPRGDGDGEVRRAYLKRLVKRAGDTLIVEQFNPVMELPIPLKHVHKIYRVFPPKELMGT